MKEQIYACCKELRLSTTFAENAMSMSGDTPQEYAKYTDIPLNSPLSSAALPDNLSHPQILHFSLLLCA